MDSIEDLKNKIDKFNKARDWDQFHSPANLAKSIVLEAAELLEHFQWNEDEYDKDAVKDELADVVNYCIQMSMALDIDLLKAVEDKMKKNAKKYPVSKSKGSSKKYTELDSTPKAASKKAAVKEDKPEVVVEAKPVKGAKTVKAVKVEAEPKVAPGKKLLKKAQAEEDKKTANKKEKEIGFSAYDSTDDKRFFFDLTNRSLIRNEKKYADMTKKQMTKELIDYYDQMNVINYLLSEEELLFLKVNKSRIVSEDNPSYRYLRDLMLFTNKDGNLAITQEVLPAIAKALTDYKDRKVEIEEKKENAYLLVGIMRVFGALSSTQMNRILSKYTNEEIGDFYSLPFALRHIEFKDEYGTSYFALRDLGMDAVALVETQPQNLKCNYSKKELIGIGKAYYNIHSTIYKKLAKNSDAVALLRRIDKEELIRAAGRGDELKQYLIDFYASKTMTDLDKKYALDLVNSLPRYDNF
ncbi:MAG: nucleotide pyrophosphohydrolase [Acholeplasmatales bacterium]|nr:nucleotide pyrophosphohydrolase [Acholeplasmatales bacterium]